MKSLLLSINHPVESFQKGNKVLSLLLVALTIFMNTVFGTVIYYLSNTDYIISVSWIVKTSFYGILTYLIFCIILFVVCKCFRSSLRLTDHLSTWGLTYLPNVLCAFVLTFSERFYDILWNSELLGMLFSITFIGLLIWKTILYFIYLREFANLKKFRLAASFIILCIFVLILAALNGYLGLKTPVL